MVVDLKVTLESLCKSSKISLPTYKENKWEIIYKENANVSTEFNGKEPSLPFISSEVINAGIIDWKRLSAVDEGCKAVYEVTFDVAGSNPTFKPGDTIGVIPRNDGCEVEQILKHLNLSSKADLEYTLVNGSPKGNKLPPHIPVKSTLRHVLSHCCDIRSYMKKAFLLALSQHTKEDNERRVLEHLSSREGSDAYNYILSKHICILDLFDIFKSCKPPVEVLLANLPRLLPRQYSIVNSSLVDPDVIKICFSITELGNNRKGTVTGWIERMINSEIDIEGSMRTLSIEKKIHRHVVPIYLRKNISGFSVPDDLEMPLILIGPGTGVSPFIGFLQERKCLKELYPEKKLGQIWLFFGCRDPKLDFIYEEELKEFLNIGILSKLSTSFSRIENSENKYIQDALLTNGEEIVDLINKGAAIFVCGDVAKMATQVKETLLKCLIKHGGQSQPEAETLLSDLQTGKRYLIDAWN